MPRYCIPLHPLRVHTLACPGKKTHGVDDGPSPALPLQDRHALTKTNETARPPPPFLRERQQGSVLTTRIAPVKNSPPGTLPDFPLPNPQRLPSDPSAQPRHTETHHPGNSGTLSIAHRPLPLLASPPHPCDRRYLGRLDGWVVRSLQARHNHFPNMPVVNALDRGVRDNHAVTPPRDVPHLRTFLLRFLASEGLPIPASFSTSSPLRASCAAGRWVTHHLSELYPARLTSISNFPEQHSLFCSVSVLDDAQTNSNGYILFDRFFQARSGELLGEFSRCACVGWWLGYGGWGVARRTANSKMDHQNSDPFSFLRGPAPRVSISLDSTELVSRNTSTRAGHGCTRGTAANIPSFGPSFLPHIYTSSLVGAFFRICFVSCFGDHVMWRLSMYVHIV